MDLLNKLQRKPFDGQSPRSTLCHREKCWLKRRNSLAATGTRRNPHLEESRMTPMNCKGTHKKKLFVGLIGIALTGTAIAQVTPNVASLIGTPAHSRVLPVRFGQVNLDSGDLHLEIPLYSVPERGLPSNGFELVYDSYFWHSIQDFGQDPLGASTSLYPTGTGWSLQPVSANGTFSAYAVTSSVTNCSSQRLGDEGTITISNQWTGVDSRGTQHVFLLTTVRNTCAFPATPTQPSEPDTGTSPQSSGGQAYANDGTGYRLTVASDGFTSGVLAPDGTAGAGDISSGSDADHNLKVLWGNESPNGNVQGSYGYPVVNGAYSSFDELGGPGELQGLQNCVAPGGGTLAITTISQVVSYQPYAAQSNVTCTGTLPGWDSTTEAKTTLTYTFVYQYIPVCTKLFNDTTGNYDYCGGMWVMKSITLPQGLGEYTFGYDTGTSGTHLGLLTSITLPTGGMVSYTYGTPPSSTISNDTPYVTSVADLGGTTNLAYAGGIWNPYPETITFPPHPTKPDGTVMVRDKREITAGNSSTSVTAYPPYTIDDYSGSTLIESTVENRDSANRITSVARTWKATGESHTVQIKYADDPSLPGYQSYGGVPINLIAQESEYDSGTLIRKVTTQYIKDTSAVPYVSQYNMINYPLSQTVSSGAATVAQTLFTYDEYGANYCSTMLKGISGAAGHDDARGVGYFARGNVTTVKRLTSGGLYSTTHTCYDTLGNVAETIDGNGHETQYSYADSYLDSECIRSGANTYAFPTLITDPLGHDTQASYYTCNRSAGKVQTQNDINNSRSGTLTTYYADGRIDCITKPDGGQTCASYPNLNEVDKAVTIDPQTSDTVKSILDPYGRAINVIDMEAGSEVDTSYDALGEVNCVTNPYSTPGGSSALRTCYAYDALGRVTGVLNPDGGVSTTQYIGNSSITTDPIGNETKKTVDAAGRITNVFEPTTPNTTPTIETDYSYDALNDLTKVTQWGGPTGSTGARVRSFTYDGLSRLITASNPETGTICYGTWSAGNCQSGYDANGNLLSKTDARGVQTSFSYDWLNRLVSKSHTNDSSGTPVSCFQYDASSVTGAGGSSGNLIGRLTNEWTQKAGTTCTVSGTSVAPVQGSFLTLNSYLDYDPVGRPTSLQEQHCIGAACSSPTIYSLNMGYNFHGDISSLTNSVGAENQPLVLTNYYNNAGRPCLTTSNWGGNSSSPFPKNLFSVTQYEPFGGLQKWYFGSTSTQVSTSCGSITSPLSVTQGYTNRLQINNITVTGQVQ